MDVIVRFGEASAKSVWEEIPDAPTYSTVRKLLSVLEEKGHVRHREDGKAYIYSAALSHAKMATTALRRLRDTFFGGSTEQVVTGLLNLSDTQLESQELSRIAKMIEEARNQEDQNATS